MDKSNTQLVYEHLLDFPQGHAFMTRNLAGKVLNARGPLTNNQISAALDSIERRGGIRCLSRVGMEGGGAANVYEWTNEERHLHFGKARSDLKRCREPGGHNVKPKAPLVNRFARLSDELLDLSAAAERHRLFHANAGSRKRPMLSRAEVLLACAERAEALEKRIEDLLEENRLLGLRVNSFEDDSSPSSFWGNVHARKRGWQLIRAGDGWKIVRDPLAPVPFASDEEAVQFVRERATGDWPAHYHDAWELAGQP